MAYATKWTLSFKSLRDVSYTVNILVDGFSGTAKRLRAAEKPFTIDENNSDDYFETIRTQSGYIRIINEETDLDGNAFDYSELIATNAMSHQVQLLSGQTILWVGYIKPVVLTSTLFGYKNVVEIPIQCPLSVLGAINLKFNSDLTFPTMGQIFHAFFSRLGIAWNNLYLTANVKHIDQVNNAWPFPDLNSRISMFNFSDNEDPTMASGSTFTNYSAEWEDETPAVNVLDDICQFWGWSLYVRGLNIYLVAPGIIHNYYEIGFNSLALPLGSGTQQSAALPTDIADLNYMSTSHTEEYLQGYRKITIDADANSDDLVFDPMLQDLEYETPGSVYTYGSGNNRYKSLQTWLTNPQLQHKLFLHNCRIFENPADLQAIDKYNVLCFEDNWKVGISDDYEDRKKNEVKNSFNLKQNTVIYSRSGTAPADPTTRQELEEQTYLAMTTLQEVAIPATSQLCLFANVKMTLDPTTSYKTKYTDYIRMYLRIGNYWWTGSSWTQNMSVFKVYMTDNGEFLTTQQIYSQSTLNALYPGAKGYIVHVSSTTMRGIMEVGILNFPSWRSDIPNDGPHQFNVQDFDVRCVVQDNIVRPQNKNHQTYEGVASLMFNNDYTVSLRMASGDKNLFGKGQLFNSTANGERLTYCKYYDVAGNIAPEQYLLTNMKRVYGQTRHRIKIEVQENPSHTNPLNQFTYNNKNYILQSVKHDYWNDKMTLTLIEE